MEGVRFLRTVLSLVLPPCRRVPCPVHSSSLLSHARVGPCSERRRCCVVTCWLRVVVQAPLSPSATCYRLFGIVQHIGNRAGGHYVAYVREGDVWKHASDSDIRESSLPELKKSEVSPSL